MVLCVKFSQLLPHSHQFGVFFSEKRAQKLFIRNQTIDIFNPRAPPEKSEHMGREHNELEHFLSLTVELGMEFGMTHFLPSFSQQPERRQSEVLDGDK
jgi:hypothetical protein